ncbi:hypothetical protein UT300012_23380 [Paraclostridium bifermentans]
MLFKKKGKKIKKRVGVYNNFEETGLQSTKESTNRRYCYGLMLREIYNGDNSDLLNRITNSMAELKTEITSEWLSNNQCKLENLEERIETLAKLELCTGKCLNLDCITFDFRENVVPAKTKAWSKRMYFEDFREWKKHQDLAYVNYWDWLDYTRSAYGETYHINSSTPIDLAMYLKGTFIKYSRNFKNPKSMTEQELKVMLEDIMGYDFIIKMIKSIPSNISVTYKELMDRIDRNPRMAKAYINYRKY